MSITSLKSPAKRFPPTLRWLRGRSSWISRSDNFSSMYEKKLDVIFTPKISKCIVLPECNRLEICKFDIHICDLKKKVPKRMLRKQGLLRFAKGPKTKKCPKTDAKETGAIYHCIPCERILNISGAVFLKEKEFVFLSDVTSAYRHGSGFMGGFQRKGS